MSNIHGLHGRRKDASASPTNRQAGGSGGSNATGPGRDLEEFSQGGAQSSTAVLRPTNGAQRDGPTSTRDVVQQARRALELSSSSTASGGTADRNIGVITMYNNGFIIGSGEFRDVRDARNAQFLADLKRGDVPVELEEMCRNEWGQDIETVNVNLVDKTGEAYTPPKPKFSFSESRGQVLSSSSSSSSSSSTAAASPEAATDAATFASARPQRYANPAATSAPTVIQIVAADRRRFRESLHGDATVLQLYQHIMEVVGLRAGTFEMMGGYPPKPVVGAHKTLKDAGLVGASIQIRPLQ